MEKGQEKVKKCTLFMRERLQEKGREISSWGDGEQYSPGHSVTIGFFFKLSKLTSPLCDQIKCSPNLTYFRLKLKNNCSQS